MMRTIQKLIRYVKKDVSLHFVLKIKMSRHVVLKRSLLNFIEIFTFAALAAYAGLTTLAGIFYTHYIKSNGADYPIKPNGADMEFHQMASDKWNAKINAKSPQFIQTYNKKVEALFHNRTVDVCERYYVRDYRLQKCPTNQNFQKRRNKRDNDAFQWLYNFPSVGINHLVQIYEFLGDHPTDDEFDAIAVQPPFQHVVVRNLRTRNGVDVSVPVMLRAELSRDYMPNGNRIPIPQSIYQRMILLERNNADDAGHILAYSLGGGMFNEFNYVPQYRRVNRNTRQDLSVWFTIEREISRYLQSSSENRVDWQTIVLYDNNGGLRPTGFMLSYRMRTATSAGQDDFVNYCFNNAVDEDGCLAFMRYDRP